MGAILQVMKMLCFTELSTTAKNIGKRAEEESHIVTRTTETGNQARDKMNDSVENQKAQMEIAQTMRHDTSHQSVGVD